MGFHITKYLPDYKAVQLGQKNVKNSPKNSTFCPEGWDPIAIVEANNHSIFINHPMKNGIEMEFTYPFQLGKK